MSEVGRDLAVGGCSIRSWIGSYEEAAMGGGEEVGTRPSLRLLLSISEDAELRLPRARSLSQAVLKQFGGGYADSVFADEGEAQQHSKLEKLYISTRAAKHFQRDIVRGVEGYIVTGSKQVEIGNKLCEDGKKYGVENTCTSGSTLSRAALSFAKARSLMEKERANLLKAFGTQGLADHKDQPALELLSAQIYNLKVQPALVSTIFGDRVVRPRLQTIKVHILGWSCLGQDKARGFGDGLPV